MKRDMLENVIKIGLAAAVIFGAFPDAAWAQQLSDSVTSVEKGLGSMPVVLSGVAYLAGGATMLHGAGLLKKHADAPTQTTLGAGVSRLAIGGVIAALPVAMSFAAKTLGQDSTELGFKAMDKITGG